MSAYSQRFTTRCAILLYMTVSTGALAWLVHANPSSRAQELADPPPETPLRISVESDATRSAPADPDALRAATLRAPLPSDTASPPSPGSEEDWFAWGRLNAPRVDAQITSAEALPADSARAYAVHSGEGATLCLANRSEQKMEARVRIRLPRGVYRIERLTLSPPLVKAEQERPAAKAGTRLARFHRALRQDTYVGRLEWLEGRDLARTADVVKFCALEPGQVCLIRYTDEATAVHQALADLDHQRHAMAASAPGAARQLSRILHEGDAYRGDLRAGRGHESGREKRLGRIHRLLLVVAQAHSLQRNLLVRRIVAPERGAAVTTALQNLMDALAQTSAVLLGLVPQITVEMPAPGGMDASAADWKTTVALANTGDQSVGMVKIGLELSALPSGIGSDPADPAFFGTLRPGQTVRAAFTLHGPGMTSAAQSRIVGDVSYFMSGTPAHLRPRPW